ncbi:S8 family serine peptidase [Aerosakkonema funiforme]|uniref:S8 family serine peptidase n=1 Tax=Aerosakkonema funiforme TaxID=1246630 RepID=UPI0035BB0F45
MSTFDIGSLNNSYTNQDTVGVTQPDDIYSFTLTDTRYLKLSLTGISNPVDWQLKDNFGTTLHTGSFNTINPETINFDNLPTGNYFLQLSQTGDDTNYTLKVDPISKLEVESGFFTVGQAGQVGVDYLTDGGSYQGELGIFSLTGIEAFIPGSEAFIKEVARRIISNSVEGHIVITDATEGAKFSPTFPWGDNYNSGEYKGVKTFAMKPGDKFGFMLVPNGSVQEVFGNPNIGGAKRPLFSLATANPTDAFYVGQIADVIGDGKTFVMEDKRVDSNSDKDYNDIIFRVTGATGVAIKLDEVIAPAKDWRNTKVGEYLRNYINTPPKFLQFNTQENYKVGEAIKLTDAKVWDENGDLDKVNFWLKRDNSDWNRIEVPANNFTFDEDWATFNYFWTPEQSGNYQLKAVAIDNQKQESNEVIKTFEVKPNNIAPTNLEFTIPASIYFGDPPTLTGKVYDENGSSDIKQVDFLLQKDGGNWQDISDVTTFMPDSTDNRWATFSYTNLSGLEVGNYKLKAIAYDSLNQASNETIQSFAIVTKPAEPLPNKAPQFLQFSLLPTYQSDSSIAINGGKVFDEDGVADLKKVHFKLQKDGNDWNEFDYNLFTPDSQGNGWASFNYSWNGLAPGNYTLEAIAYDKANAESNKVVQNFTVENILPPPPPPPPPPPLPLPPPPPPPPPINKPELLQFRTMPLYTNGETLSFSGAKVFDRDGANDIDKVFFWLGTIDGKKVDTIAVDRFTTDSKGWARFDLNYNLSKLTPGRYQLWAIARDKAGNESDRSIQNFSVITDPGDGGLSDSVKIAIARSADLEKYDPEELAKTREWVVWVTPDRYSLDLATLAGAEDLGNTGYIPNTYIWRFSENDTPDIVQPRLGTIPGVEFAYPLVPKQVTLLSEPEKEPLVKDVVKDGSQWHLRSDILPSADANITKAWGISIPGNPSQKVRGKGVVIGIVDDGFDYENHPDLKDRFLPNLSMDFNENDNSPLPSYKATVSKDVNRTIKDNTSRQDFSLDVALTGVVKDINVGLNITHPYVSDLEASLLSPTEPIYNPNEGLGSTSPRRIWGGNGSEDQIGLFDDVGGDGDNFINTILDDQATIRINDGVAPFTGRFIPQSKIPGPGLDYFNQQWASGFWKLRMADDSWGNKGQLNRWWLEFNTYNPHGTAVAGIALASGDNNFGGSGVAPEANLAGLRLIADQVTDKQIADALSFKNQDIDIYNNSWKVENAFTTSPLNLMAMEQAVKTGRNQLGNIYVFAGGNDRSTGGNVNYNGFANSRYAIAVAAINKDGEQTTYSEPGTPLLVSAYSSSLGEGRGITTTDLVGADGYDPGDYTKSFGGTSAAAPLVSGVIALMLEANPNLSWRDVQHILAKTANKNNPTDKGWVQNGAKLWVNDKYGFGAIDAFKAVNTAATWTPVDREVKVSSNLQNVIENIPDGDQDTGVNSQISFYEDITVEKVEVELYSDHKNWKDLRVVLTSPDGTESVLARPQFSNDSNVGQIFKPNIDRNSWMFNSVRHWGESSKGEWTLKVFDENGNQIQGDLDAWKLNVYGTKPKVTISAVDANATENSDPGQFVVTRTGSTKNPLTVNYTIGGTATNGTDYNSISGSVIIPAGANSAAISINTVGKDDTIYEGNETVILTLVSGNSYNVGSENTATVAIADNDLDPTPTVVTNTNDSGSGSLRNAIDWANKNPGKDTIRFNISTADPGYNASTGAFTIRPTSALPTITDAVVIDGTTQGGFVGKPIIELDGSNAGSNTNGLTITAGNSTVRGMVINRFQLYGIALQTKGNNLIEGNYIGTDITGTQDLGNFEGINIRSANNTIGGTTIDSRNILSGNYHGIMIEGSKATGNQVLGNYIGTDIIGTQDLGNSFSGILIMSDASNNIIGGTVTEARNLISGNDNYGVVIQGLKSTGNQVLGNYIGTDVNGTKSLGNSITGIEITDNASKNIIGGLTAGSGNIISGNGSGNSSAGISIIGSENQILGNYIGTDVTGTKAIGNFDSGVLIGFGSNNIIGGTTTEARNIISGNKGIGVSLQNIGTTNNQVLGNYIGTDITGTKALGNSSPGVSIFNAPNNIIGGTSPAARNLISSNYTGVNIGGVSATGNLVQGNYIGTDVTGSQGLGNNFAGVSIFGGSNNTIGGTANGTGNTIAFNQGIGVQQTDKNTLKNAVLSNAIFSNTGLGIDLWDNNSSRGLTPNDMGDTDTGANNLQNFPVLTSAISNTKNTTIQGTLNSTPNRTFRVEFFSNSALDASGYGEGEKFVGFKNVTTDSSGNANFIVSLPTALPAGQFITATATDSNQNTSEFSQGIAIINKPAELLWTKQWGTSSDDRTSGAAVDNAGNIYISGLTMNQDVNNNRSYTPWVIKYDSSGNQQIKQLDTFSSEESSSGTVVDSAGNTYILGYTYKGQNSGDAIITKYDSSGILQWMKQIGSSGADSAKDLAVDSAGNVYIVGSATGSLEGNNAGSGGFWVGKYNNSGNQQWIKQLGTSISVNDVAITVDNNGNFYIVGYTSDLQGNGNSEAWVAKYDNNGNQQWAKQFGSPNPEYVKDVAVDSAGNVYIVGETTGSLGGNNAGGTDTWIAKYDYSGNQQWLKQLGTGNTDSPRSVTVDNAGNVYMVGSTYGILEQRDGTGGLDGWVAKYDSRGNQLWVRQLGTFGSDVATNVVADSTDNLYVVGYTNGLLGGNKAGSMDAWVMKFS